MNQDQPADHPEPRQDTQPSPQPPRPAAAHETHAPTLPAPVSQPAAVQPPSPEPSPAPAQPSPGPEPAQNLYNPTDAQPRREEAPAPSPQTAETHDSPAASRPNLDFTPPPAPADLQMQDNGEEVVWTASEFIQHEKSPNWYMALAGISLAAVVLVYLLTRDVFNAIIVVIAAVLFGVVARRQPRRLQYVVNDHGIGIGRRFYSYDDFRSFSLLDEGAVRSFVLMPLKRFMPALTLYYDPKDEGRIGDVLADHLPFAEHKHELTDRLMRKIRF